MRNPEDFAYAGDCGVCGEPIDMSDFGICAVCSLPFHWGDCGGWGDTDNTCNDCKNSDGSD